jgi:CRP/FNR family transcriptional regulator, cyclic AMP receptor protein
MKLHRDAKADLIRTIPLFAQCTAAELASVAAIADEIDLREGRQLATESAPGQEFVVVVEGTADVMQDGRVINSIGPGEFFGEIALVTGRPRTATVVATSAMHALVIEGHAFQRLMNEAPDIRAKVERAAGERLDRDAHQAEA